jgi:hypothetical protein
MKNFKVFTVAALIGASAMTFTSCGDKTNSKEGKDGEEKSEEKATGIDLSTGNGNVMQLVEALESGTIGMDKANASEIEDYFDMKGKASGDNIYGSSTFTGLKLNKSFTIFKNVLYQVSYSSFYDKGKEDLAKADNEELTKYFTEKFGKSSGSEKYMTWDTKNYKVSYSIYDDGYTIGFVSANVDKAAIEKEENKVAGASLDQVQKLIPAVVGGTIKLNSSTPSEIATIMGEGMKADDYYMSDKIQYASHYLNRNISITDKKVTSIKFSTFQDTDECTDLNDVVAYLETTLGSKFTTEGSTKKWTNKGFSVSITTYTGSGYDLTIE